MSRGEHSPRQACNSRFFTQAVCDLRSSKPTQAGTCATVRLSGCRSPKGSSPAVMRVWAARGIIRPQYHTKREIGSMADYDRSLALDRALIIALDRALSLMGASWLKLGLVRLRQKIE